MEFTSDLLYAFIKDVHNHLISIRWNNAKNDYIVKSKSKKNKVIPDNYTLPELYRDLFEFAYNHQETIVSVCYHLKTNDFETLKKYSTYYDTIWNYKDKTYMISKEYSTFCARLKIKHNGRYYHIDFVCPTYSSIDAYRNTKEIEIDAFYVNMYLTNNVLRNKCSSRTISAYLYNICAYCVSPEYAKIHIDRMHNTFDKTFSMLSDELKLWLILNNYVKQSSLLGVKEAARTIWEKNV